MWRVGPMSVGMLRRALPTVALQHLEPKAKLRLNNQRTSWPMVQQLMVLPQRWPAQWQLNSKRWSLVVQQQPDQSWQAELTCSPELAQQLGLQEVAIDRRLIALTRSSIASVR